MGTWTSAGTRRSAVWRAPSRSKYGVRKRRWHQLVRSSMCNGNVALVITRLRGPGCRHQPSQWAWSATRRWRSCAMRARASRQGRRTRTTECPWARTSHRCVRRKRMRPCASTCSRCNACSQSPGRLWTLACYVAHDQTDGAADRIGFGADACELRAAPMTFRSPEKYASASGSTSSRESSLSG